MLAISFSPFPVLHTQRLLLRALTADDTAQMFMLRTDADTLQFLDRHPMQSLAEAALMIKKITDDIINNESITWAIVLKDEPSILMGTIGFWRMEKEHYRAEIGYMLLPAWFKKGYMKEAAAAVINYGFSEMHLHSIEANINTANEASEKLLQRMGFVKEAYFKENFYFNGQFLDSVIYSLINRGPEV